MRRFLAAAMLMSLTAVTPQMSYAETEPVQMPGTSHWYEVVYSPGTWQDSLTSALHRSFNGLRGHLATVTSTDENDFIKDLDGATRLWLGGRDIGSTSTFAKRTWSWVTGPDNGTVFTTCAEPQGRDNCTTTSGGFARWDWLEPNNYQGEETFLVTNWDSPGRWNDCYAPNCHSASGYGFVVEYEAWTPPLPPEQPSQVAARAFTNAARISWSSGADTDPDAPVSFAVVSNPDGLTCTTTELSCEISGLRNRIPYSFSVTANNRYGSSAASTSGTPVIPLDPGFQVWPTTLILTPNSTTSIHVGNAPALSDVTITGAGNVSLLTDGLGCASTSISLPKPGSTRISASYVVRVGGKTTKFTTTSRVFVPALLAPAMRIKQGKTAKFSLQFLPPEASVSITLSDGQTIVGTANSAGKVTLTATLQTLGTVTYTTSVAGVQIRTGGLTVTK